MSSDEDVWPRQLRQMGGLRLIGARPGGVRLVSVGHGVSCLRLVGAWQDMGSFIGKRHVGEVASPRRSLDGVWGVC